MAGAVERAADMEHDRIHSLWDVIAYHAARAPDAPALQFEGRKTSYAGLVAAAEALAASLVAGGLARGQRVAYLGKNSDVYFVLLYALARAGAVLVPLNWRLAPEEWAFIMRDAEAVRLFADSAYLPAATALSTELNLPPAELIPAESAAPDAALIADLPLPAADDVLFQVYTSGTTGRPKGAMLTHRNMLALRAPGYRAGLRWFPGFDDSSLVVLPVAHIAGTAWALFGIYGGGRVVIGREFDPGRTLDLIEAEAITHILLAPAAMRLILEHPDAAPERFRTLRYITYGASTIPLVLLERSLEMFGCGFVQMYGMTEAAGGVVALQPEDHAAGDPQLLRSAGRAMPGVEIAIADESGAHLPPGENGEILVKSDAVMPGYWRLPEATAETIVDGWLHSGDVGYMDEAGYLFVLDRVKDMIISGGENIYPAEVENAIFGHPDVADVAVIGVPSEKWGEDVLAIIVPKPGCRPELASIAGWTRERIASFKAPKHLRIVDTLPRNAGNKVLRRILRDQFAPDTDGG